MTSDAEYKSNKARSLIVGGSSATVSTESKGGRFKVKIAARLEEGEAIEGKETPECYAEMNGLSIEGVRLPSPVAHDAVDERVWLPTTGALAEKRDSGWEME